MKYKLNDSTISHCRTIEFKGGKVLIDNREVRESDFLEALVRISDDDFEMVGYERTDNHD